MINTCPTCRFPASTHDVNECIDYNIAHPDGDVARYNVPQNEQEKDRERNRYRGIYHREENEDD